MKCHALQRRHFVDGWQVRRRRDGRAPSRASDGPNGSWVHPCRRGVAARDVGGVSKTLHSDALRLIRPFCSSVCLLKPIATASGLTSPDRRCGEGTIHDV
jgi:hypothetical protein